MYCYATPPVEDYHLTAASSVVKMIVEGYKGHSGSAASSVTVTDRDVGLALTACQVYLNTLDHDDIESSSTVSYTVILQYCLAGVHT